MLLRGASCALGNPRLHRQCQACGPLSPTNPEVMLNTLQVVRNVRGPTNFPSQFLWRLRFFLIIIADEVGKALVRHTKYNSKDWVNYTGSKPSSLCSEHWHFLWKRFTFLDVNAETFPTSRMVTANCKANNGVKVGEGEKLGTNAAKSKVVYHFLVQNLKFVIS